MQSRPVTKIRHPRPLIGWTLSKLIECDAAHPGILRYTLQASPLRRQAIFLTLSHPLFDTPEVLAARLCRIPFPSPFANHLSDICLGLMTLRVREVVQALYPGVDGLLGALNRLGDRPLPLIKYRVLVHMLSDRDKRRAKVLQQLESITDLILSSLWTLDPAFLRLDLIRRFHTVTEVESFNAAIALIRHIVPNVVDADLLASIKALPASVDLEDWAQRWVTKAVFSLLLPVQDDEEWMVLRTGRAMAAAAQRYQNCLKRRIATCAVGRAAYVEWKSEPAIIELAALSGMNEAEPIWALEGTYGYQNARVAQHTIEAICDKVRKAGILVPAKLGHARHLNKAASLLTPGDFDPLRRLGGPTFDEFEAVLAEVQWEMEAAE